MTPLTLRGFVRRRAALVTAVLLLLAVVVIAHHGLPTDMDGMPGAAVCLAIATAAVTVATGAANLFLPRPVLSRSAPLIADVWTPAPYGAPARAGPLFLLLQVV